MKNENEEFIAHGYYVVSNAIGYEVELNKSCDGARLRIDGKVTDWLDIEYIVDEDSEEGDSIPVIDTNVTTSQ